MEVLHTPAPQPSVVVARQVRREPAFQRRSAQKRVTAFVQCLLVEADAAWRVARTAVSETLHKIEEALSRLEEGTYGNCFECGDEIAERRLRALPFAVRCKECEEARELAERRERQLTQRRSSGFLIDLN